MPNLALVPPSSTSATTPKPRKVRKKTDVPSLYRGFINRPYPQYGDRPSLLHDAAMESDDPPHRKARELTAVLRAVRSLDCAPITPDMLDQADWIVRELWRHDGTHNTLLRGPVELAQILEEVFVLSEVVRCAWMVDPKHPAACSEDDLNATGWTVQCAIEWAMDTARHLAAATLKPSRRGR